MTDGSKSWAGSLPEELLDGSPSSVAKLVAAWDALPGDAQIFALQMALKPDPARRFDGPLIDKALESANPYIRYLGARRFELHRTKFHAIDPVDQVVTATLDPWREETKARIERDADPLVRTALLESPAIEIDAAGFFAQPQEARLAMVRGVDGGSADIARLMAYAQARPEAHRIAERELVEILADYLMRPEFALNYPVEPGRSDPTRRVETGAEDIAALWAVASRSSKSLKHLLCAYLPAEIGGDMVISEQDLARLDDEALFVLLRRGDVRLPETRRAAYFRSYRGRRKKQDYRIANLRWAAVRRHFDLADEEFEAVSELAGFERRDRLEVLVRGEDLRWCLVDAILDLLFPNDVWNQGAGGKPLLRARIETTASELREARLLELKLYRLALRVGPWTWGTVGPPPPPELALLAAPGDEQSPWKRFTAYKKRWSRLPATERERHYPFLPAVPEAGDIDPVK